MDLDYLEAKLEEAGELHVVVEEHEAVTGPEEDYIGLRKHNTTFDQQNNVIVVDDGTTEHVIDSDRIVYYHAPTDFPD